jgi:hypothetical protein
MSTQSLALSAADAVSEEDYQAFLAALSASARGRAFLGEYARRQRQTDTAALLEAVTRLEAQLASQPPRADDIAHELSALAENVRGLRSQIDAVQLTGAVTQLAATLETIQRRLSLLASDPPPEANSEADPRPRRPKAEPEPVQQPFSLALTAVAAQAIAAADTEDEAIKVIKAGTIPPPPPFAGEDFAASNLQVDALAEDERAAQHEHGVPLSGTGADPMLQILALSEEERLALFS